MDAWLANIEADTSNDPRAVKVVRNKPADLGDSCWTGDAEPFTFVAEHQFLGGPGTSACNDLYPGFTFPRFMAGMLLSNDIVKCHLRPIDLADYEVAFTRAELARLHQIFPEGVCDWSRPGVEQRDPLSPWITYTGVGTYKRDRDGEDD